MKNNPSYLYNCFLVLIQAENGSQLHMNPITPLILDNINFQNKHIDTTINTNAQINTANNVCSDHSVATNRFSIAHITVYLYHNNCTTIQTIRAAYGLEYSAVHFVTHIYPISYILPI